MAVRANKRLEQVTACPHGSVGIDEMSALGTAADAVIDFSVCTNPFGPSPKVLQALRSVDISRYPDPEATSLRCAIADRLALSPSNIFVGNGTSEIILLLAVAYLSPGDTAYIVGPTYGEYERAARIAGANVITHAAKAEDGFAVDMAKLGEEIESASPRAIFICNPNNPTGMYFDPSDLEGLFSQFEDALFVLDEAYISFVQGGRSCAGLLPRDNLAVLHSMTKEHALAGLRLGYCAGSPTIIEDLRKVAPPWSVNSMAQAAGVAALQDKEHLTRSLDLTAEAKVFLTAALEEEGFKVYPSAANFFLVQIGDGAEFRRRLMTSGICVRDCASFGLPEFIRIGVRTLPECERLVEAMKAVC